MICDDNLDRPPELFSVALHSVLRRLELMVDRLLVGGAVNHVCDCPPLLPDLRTYPLNLSLNSSRNAVLGFK